MPKAKRGILIKTDVATKIFLGTLKETFIIKDIDDTSLFIDDTKLDYVREKV